MPPDFAYLSTLREVDPNTVLVGCDNHYPSHALFAPTAAQRAQWEYPFHLVLRADGSVGRIHISRIKTVHVPGSAGFTGLYPGEPGYDQAVSVAIW